MRYTLEEEERIEAIQRFLEGKRPVDIYQYLGHYKDEDLIVREIRRISYEMPEKVYNRKHSIFRSGLE